MYALRSAAPLVLSILCTTLALGAELPPGVKVERDVEFANPAGQHLKLNIARPAGGGARPAVLCIHGGGFRAGTREGYDGMCQMLASHGYVAATVTYRLAPAFQFPAAVQDCKAAVRWMRAHAADYGIDPAHIGVMGGSAGGHLAQFLGVTAGVHEFEGTDNPGPSDTVQCVVNFYGPSDFTQSYGHSVDAHEVLPLFFGGNLEQKRPEHIRGSPLYWVTPNAAPTLCIHGDQDKYVAVDQARWIVDRLKASAVPADLLVLQGAGHGFKPDEEARAEVAMLGFFDHWLAGK
jgi:acetyl esterase/lipase